MEDLNNIVEAIMFALGREISVDEISKTLEVEKDNVVKAIEELKEKYTQDSGVKLIEVNGMVQLVTNNKYYEYVNKFVENTKRQNLSVSAQETLAIIAYNPKITRAEIEAVRGVNSDGTIYKLLEYNLIENVGKADLPGRPTMYEVTENFLKMFGISSLEELPELPRYKLDENEQIVIEDIVEAPMPERESTEVIENNDNLDTTKVE